MRTGLMFIFFGLRDVAIALGSSPFLEMDGGDAVLKFFAVVIGISMIMDIFEFFHRVSK